MEPSSQKNVLTVPIAIIVAGLLVAGAVFLSNGGIVTPQAAKDKDIAKIDNGTQKQDVNHDIRPIGNNDHIRGNPQADIIIVEYSDTECPFCKSFHETMKQIISEYGKTGKVAWVYRHFPIVQLHSKAPKEAEATECAAELGGNAKFWEYIDALFDATPSNNKLDAGELPSIAARTGLDKIAFDACLSSGKHGERVQDDYKNGVSIGINGTPYSVILAKNGQKIPINGAQPYNIIKETIDNLLR